MFSLGLSYTWQKAGYNHFVSFCHFASLRGGFVSLRSFASLCGRQSNPIVLILLQKVLNHDVNHSLALAIHLTKP